MLPERVPLNNGVYKSLFLVTVRLRRPVSSPHSEVWMSGEMQRAELKS